MKKEIVTVDFITPLQLGPNPITRYKWQNHNRHPCQDCADLDGQVRTMQEWLKVRQHKHCHCSLEPVDEKQDGIAFSAETPGLTAYNIDGSASAIVKAPFFIPLAPIIPHPARQT